MPNHTTGPQDTSIDEALVHADKTGYHVRVLIETIDELDDKLDDWVEASGHDDPEDLVEEMVELRDTITNLRDQINNLEKGLS